MLGRPVVRRLVKEDFSVRAMARDVDKARELLPPSVELVKGDIASIDDIRAATDGMDAVYLNLHTPNHKAAFRPELDGTRNVLAALKSRTDITVVKLSALGMRDTGGWWPDADEKAEAEGYIMTSGLPYVIFKPTWFMESLPLFAQDKRFIIFGKPAFRSYWIAGDDYGRMVSEALRKEITDKTYNVQGPEALSFDEAARRFIEALGRKMKIVHMPKMALRAGSLFSPAVKDLLRLFQFCERNPEEQQSLAAWRELYRPRMTIEEYVLYMQTAMDVPRK
jgi:uncharacterized protein YbjT (DUF2867 family)